MSKRLQNYPDPMEVFDKYGADVLRMYLLSSPVMAAENLSLKESELQEMQRGFFRMLWNSYYFFILYASTDNWQPKENFDFSENLLDKWILSKVENLNQEVEKNMQAYNLPASARLFFTFVDDLSNWYIRRSRKRFWKSENDADKSDAYQTLHYVLNKISKLLAPFAPFVSEEIYRNLTSGESVHLQEFPVAKSELIDSQIVEDMSLVRKIVEIGLSKRAEAKIKVRQPLMEIKYRAKQLSAELESIIADEVNVRSINFDSSIFDDVHLDTTLSEDLLAEGYAREFIRSVQSLRKKSDFNISDRIETFFQTDSDELSSAIKKYEEIIKRETLSEMLELKKIDLDNVEETKIEGKNVWIGVRKRSS